MQCNYIMNENILLGSVSRRKLRREIGSLSCITDVDDGELDSAGLIDDLSHSSFMIGSGNRLIPSFARSLDDRVFRTMRVTGHSRCDWSAAQEMRSQSLTFQIDIGSTGFGGDYLVLRYSTGSQERIRSFPFLIFSVTQTLVMCFGSEFMSFLWSNNRKLS